MNQLLGIFLPAVLATVVYGRLIKKEMNMFKWSIKYLLFLLFINILNYAIAIYIFSQPYFIFTNVFTLKYLILGSAIGIVLAIIACYIEKHLEINVRVEKNEK